MAAGTQLHGSFTPPTVCRSPAHCLRRFERSDCGCKGVSLSCLYVSARKPPRLLCSLGADRSLIRGHGAPAVWLDTDRMYPYALYCTAVILRAFFVKEQNKARFAICGKGDADRLTQTLNERTARMSFDRKRSRMSSSMP